MSAERIAYHKARMAHHVKMAQAAKAPELREHHQYLAMQHHNYYKRYKQKTERPMEMSKGNLDKSAFDRLGEWMQKGMSSSRSREHAANAFHNPPKSTSSTKKQAPKAKGFDRASHPHAAAIGRHVELSRDFKGTLKGKVHLAAAKMLAGKHWEHFKPKKASWEKA